MADQLPLFDLREPVRISRADVLERQTLEHLDQHPLVWALFVRFAFELIGAGHDHAGAKAIAERIRWHAATEAMGAEGYIINNSHVSCMARLFARTYPEHASFFRFRKRISERRCA